jgi:hypothetical protein
MPSALAIAEPSLNRHLDLAQGTDDRRMHDAVRLCQSFQGLTGGPPLKNIRIVDRSYGSTVGQACMGGAPNLFYGTDVFVLSLVIYDLVSRGRVHPATLWGGAMVVGFKPLLFYAVAVTPPWLAIADALRI